MFKVEIVLVPDLDVNLELGPDLELDNILQDGIFMNKDCNQTLFPLQSLLHIIVTFLNFLTNGHNKLSLVHHTCQIAR